MKNKSLWSDYQEKYICNELSKDLEVDVLVIGGGITGISTCYHLKDSKLTVALVEANQIGRGITSRTTGKITFLQENIYTKLKENKDKYTAMMYYKSQKEAINIIKNIITSNKIKCNFEKSPSYVFTNSISNKEKLQKEKRLLTSFGEKIYEINNLGEDNTSKYSYSIYANNCNVFHPLKYLDALKDIIIKAGINIYENTRIISIEKGKNNYICKTKEHIIKAKKVLIATHYPFFLNPFFFPLKVTVEKSYLVAVPTKKNNKYNAINIDKPSLSTRYHQNYLKKYQIFLKNSRNINFKINDEKVFNNIRRSHPDYKYIWSNTDIMTNDSLPFIGKIEDNLYLATGYNTWGMTNSAIAGKIISDLITKKENKYTELFNPLREMNISKIPLILAGTTYSFTESHLNKKVLNENIIIKRENGKLTGTYIDQKGKKHTVCLTCPHLKCNLVFNNTELSWDCPCHASRFSLDGKCLDGPSNQDISIKDEE